MVASLVVSAAVFKPIHARFPAGDLRADAWVMLLTVGATTLVWLMVTFMTSPEPDATLEAFYKRVRPGGPGWSQVSKRLGYGRESIPGGALAWTNWIAGIVAVYTTLFGIGKLIFGETMAGALLLVIAAAAFAWIARSFQNDQAEGLVKGLGLDTAAKP
jgi:hypothetical protein